MTNIIVLIGAGSIGQAIARRVSAGKHILLADIDRVQKPLHFAVDERRGFPFGP